MINNFENYDTIVFYNATFRDGTEFPLFALFKRIGPLYFPVQGGIGPQTPKLSRIYNAIAEEAIRKKHAIEFTEQ
jgi:hypothetical protein